MGIDQKISKQGFINWLRAHTVALLLLLAGITGAVYSGSNLVSSQNLQPVVTKSAPVIKEEPQTAKTLSRSEPVRLRISKIGVDAPILQLDLKSDGTLATPNSATAVGWYKKSPTPGETGPSVIVGHVDYINIGAAVFWHLRELQTGDIVEIDRADGTTAKFKVDSVKQFAQNNFPTAEVYGNINYAGVRLITCGGTFNKQTGHYSDNTVVFGSLITD